MCIIIAKLKGKELPKRQVLKNCWDNNDDGAGYMFTHGGQVQIKKGFLKYEDLLKSLETDYKKYGLKNKNLVIHFRIGTSGGLDASKTHPFPLTNSTKQLNNTRTKSDKGVAHNGVLSGYTYNTKMSDTQNFIGDFLHYINITLPDFTKSKNINALILNQLQGDRLAILDKDDNLKLYGDFIEDNGCYYSNNSYTHEPYKYSIPYYTNLSSLYDYTYEDQDYEDYEDYYYNEYEAYLWEQYENGQIDEKQYEDYLNDWERYIDFTKNYQSIGGGA